MPKNGSISQAMPLHSHHFDRAAYTRVNKAGPSDMSRNEINMRMAAVKIFSAFSAIAGSRRRRSMNSIPATEKTQTVYSEPSWTQGLNGGTRRPIALDCYVNLCIGRPLLSVLMQRRRQQQLENLGAATRWPANEREQSDRAIITVITMHT